MGLGFAATRDIVSYLRYETADAAGNTNVLAGQIDLAIGFGLSQSGRYLPDFLYWGFNTDETGRPVFEGLMPHIAGGKKTFTNYRFSQPGRSPYRHTDTVYPGSGFPFAYPVTTDVLTGHTDGLLARCLAAANCPKIIKTDSEIEFYQQRASLVTTDTQGNSLAMPENVRLFLLSNLQHFALASDKSVLTRTCAFPTNPLNAGPPLRALLVALDAWITTGTLPPASRYPSRDDGTLVEPIPDKVGFPHIPGVNYTALTTRPTVLNFDAMPPVKGAPYRYSSPRRMPTAAILPGCACRLWRHQLQRIPAGTCAKQASQRASCAIMMDRCCPSPRLGRSGLRITTLVFRSRNDIRTQAPAPPP
jgi:hypothetical protein